MTALEHVPSKRILRAIASAAERWSDADFPPRVRATDAICERAGYSLPVVDYALDRLFFPMTERELAAAIEGGCGILYSEDLQRGQRFGDLKIENPFVEGAAC